MLVTQVIDKKNGKRWDVYKKSENEYFYKYYEFFSSCGWRYVGQIGGYRAGYYLSKDCLFDLQNSVKEV